MHASYQIIIQALWIAYIAHKHCILNLKLMQMQASIWICTHQMQSIKFMSLLPLLVCFSCPRILILLIHVHDRTLISSPPLSSRDNSYLCSFLSPFVINDHKRAETTWNLPCEDQWLPLEVVPLVLVALPLEYPYRQSYEALVVWYKELDLGRWLSLESSFLWTLSIWLELTPLVTTTCGSMNTTLKCHM